MELYDKPRKPYVPIDTCSPAGTWIEEKRYNRTRPTGEGSRKVLCGNWQEERVLEDDMLRLEATEANQQQQQQLASSGKLGLTTAAGGSIASLDVIKDTGKGYYAGGFKSTPYLTCDVANPNARHLDTTHRVDYNAHSSDVAQLRRPDLGVRSQVLLRQALEAAKEEQAQQAKERTDLRASTAGRGERGVGGVSDLGAIHDRNTSVYRATMCDENEVLPVIDELGQEYLSDEPITLYTGNPNTGKTMTVHGKTPVDPSGTARFGRHTHFSEYKYAL